MSRRRQRVGPSDGEPLPDDPVNVLLSAVSHKRKTWAAKQVLEELRSGRAMEDLLPLLGPSVGADVDELVAYILWESTGSGRPVVNEAARLLGSQSVRVRLQVLEFLLGNLEALSARVVASVSALLGDPDEDVRVAAAVVLLRLGKTTISDAARLSPEPGPMAWISDPGKWRAQIVRGARGADRERETGAVAAAIAGRWPSTEVDQLPVALQELYKRISATARLP